MGVEYVPWIDKTGWDETLVAIAVSKDPKPIGIIAI